VNVNLSAKYLAKQNLAAEILTVIAKYGLNPSSLRLEITEDQIIANPESISQVLLRLSEAGIQILIDDFGTGYSSLAYLSRLQVHGLKIDRSFMLNLGSDERDGAIVRSIVSLGHNLGLRVIAEGVETVEQLDYLWAVNCQYVQGYYFSRPVDPDAATRLLQEGIQIGSKKKLDLSRLRAFELFADLSDESLDEVARSFKEITARPGTILIRQGQAAKDIYLLEEGSVGIYSENPGAERRLIAKLQAPALFGEKELFGAERNRAVTVRAVTMLRLLTIPISTFLIFQRQHPSVEKKARAAAAGQS
jgi:hypothetical protein